MAINDAYHKAVPDVAPGGDLVVEGQDAETGAVEVFEIGGEPDVEVYRETDTTGGGTYDTSVLIDAFSGNFHSQKNQLVVSANSNHRLRIRAVASNDTAGAVYVTGMEVNDT